MRPELRAACMALTVLAALAAFQKAAVDLRGNWHPALPLEMALAALEEGEAASLPVLQHAGAEVSMAENGRLGADLALRETFDLILMDMQMPVMDGIQFYDTVREIETESIFIIITAFGTIPSAVEAVKKGVYDYIPKPFTPDEVRFPVRRALERKRLEQENIALRSQIETRYSFQSIIGNSPEMRKAFRATIWAARSSSKRSGSGRASTEGRSSAS